MATAIDPQQVEITVKPNTDDLGQLIQLIAAEQWPLQELIPTSSSLEHTFMTLTQTRSGGTP